MAKSGAENWHEVKFWSVFQPSIFRNFPQDILMGTWNLKTFNDQLAGFLCLNKGSISESISGGNVKLWDHTKIQEQSLKLLLVTTYFLEIFWLGMLSHYESLTFFVWRKWLLKNLFKATDSYNFRCMYSKKEWITDVQKNR